MIAIKRFLVFAYYTYYPAGGWDDLIGMTDTEEEAIKIAENHNKDFAYVVDTQDIEREVFSARS